MRSEYCPRCGQSLAALLQPIIAQQATTDQALADAQGQLNSLREQVARLLLERDELRSRLRLAEDLVAQQREAIDRLHREKTGIAREDGVEWMLHQLRQGVQALLPQLAMPRFLAGIPVIELTLSLCSAAPKDLPDAPAFRRAEQLHQIKLIQGEGSIPLAIVTRIKKPHPLVLVALHGLKITEDDEGSR